MATQELPLVKTYLGLPRPLLAGYMAIALFMTGTALNWPSSHST